MQRKNGILLPKNKIGILNYIIQPISNVLIDDMIAKKLFM